MKASLSDAASCQDKFVEAYPPVPNPTLSNPCSCSIPFQLGSLAQVIIATKSDAVFGWALRCWPVGPQVRDVSPLPSSDDGMGAGAGAGGVTIVKEGRVAQEGHETQTLWGAKL